MKTNFTLISCLIVSLFMQQQSIAQCPAGTTAAQLNWDNLDFLPSNNTRYTNFYPTAAFPYTQHYAMGTRNVTFSMSPANILTLNGENNTNAAHAGSFAGAGDDVQFTTNSATSSTISFRFDVNVVNVRFSIFDIDQSQHVNITATDAAGVPQNIAIAKANGGSAMNITGSGTTSPSAAGSGSDYASNDNRGTINVSIAGPVQQVTIELLSAAGNVWLSDIDACITGSFPADYQKISRPFTNQPQYVLTVVNNNIYYVDPTNGRGYFLFNEPGHNRLNSMAYDPYERVVYYTYSLGPDPRNDRALKKYDVDTKTISVVIPNVNTFGIPSYESGVESGAATFYNGSLYLGVEGYTGTSGNNSYAAGRKSTIWKLDFDAAGNPIAPAVQVFGVTSDDGSDAQNIHDWSDFGISNGMLTDFDGSQSGDIDYYHFNMMSGARTRFAPVGGVIPRQVSIGWDEKLYNVDAAISLYNGTNGVGTLFNIFAPIGPTIPTGGGASWGDAAGPYRPFLDFGDAPGTYDPDPLSPACHDTLTPNVAGRRTKMILGPAEDVEWLKKGFTTVEDNFEDGLAFVPLFAPVTGTYLAQVSVLNNTGFAATVCAWLDYNGNGIFDASEAIAPVNVPSSAAVQNVGLNWPSITSALTTGTTTHLRIRITSASFGMNTDDATGYYSTGEVEDYVVVVNNFVLPLTIASFDAEKEPGGSVKISWKCNEESDHIRYYVERTNDGVQWEVIGSKPASSYRGMNTYQLSDNRPLAGKSWYRLRVRDTGGAIRYSAERLVNFDARYGSVKIWPNPARSQFTITIENGSVPTKASVEVYGVHGRLIQSGLNALGAGSNVLSIKPAAAWAPGSYVVYVRFSNQVYREILVLQ